MGFWPRWRVSLPSLERSNVQVLMVDVVSANTHTRSIILSTRSHIRILTVRIFLPTLPPQLIHLVELWEVHA